MYSCTALLVLNSRMQPNARASERIANYNCGANTEQTGHKHGANKSQMQSQHAQNTCAFPNTNDLHLVAELYIMLITCRLFMYMCLTVPEVWYYSAMFSTAPSVLSPCLVVGVLCHASYLPCGSPHLMVSSVGTSVSLSLRKVD